MTIQEIFYPEPQSSSARVLLTVTEKGAELAIEDASGKSVEVAMSLEKLKALSKICGWLADKAAKGGAAK